MNKSTPIHELPGNPMTEMENDSNSLVDDILKELQKSPSDALLPPPAPSSSIHASNFSNVLASESDTPVSKSESEKKYEQLVWYFDHLKVPLLICIFYILFHNRAFVTQLMNVLPISIQDPFSFGHMLFKAVLLSLFVETARTFWD